MRLSTKCRYGTRAIVEIALSYKKPPIKRKDIAAHQDINDSYLENILIALKNSSIIDTIRGAKGGFVMRRSPSTITLLEVIEALDGPIESVKCLNNPSICKRTEKCVTRPVWFEVQESQKNVLKNITVQDLVDKVGKTENLDFKI